MKKIKIGQYAKLLVAVLAMAFVAGACDDNNDRPTYNDELVGTVWYCVAPWTWGEGIAIVAKATNNTFFTYHDYRDDGTCYIGQANYWYYKPEVLLHMPEDLLKPYKTGVVSGSTLTVADEGKVFYEVDVVPEIVGTTWQGVETYSGATFRAHFTNGTQFTLMITSGTTTVNGGGTYTYNPPIINVTVTPLTPALQVYIDDPENIGVISGNKLHFFLHPILLNKVTE